MSRFKETLAVGDSKQPIESVVETEERPARSRNDSARIATVDELAAVTERGKKK